MHMMESVKDAERVVGSHSKGKYRPGIPSLQSTELEVRKISLLEMAGSVATAKNEVAVDPGAKIWAVLALGREPQAALLLFPLSKPIPIFIVRCLHGKMPSFCFCPIISLYNKDRSQSIPLKGFRVQVFIELCHMPR